MRRARSSPGCYLSSPIPPTCTNSSTPLKHRSIASARSSYVRAPRPSPGSTLRIDSLGFSVRGTARHLAADQPGPGGCLILGHPRQFGMHVERRLIAPRLDEQHVALIFLRQQHVELLAAVLGPREAGVVLHQFDKSVAMLGFNLELDDDHQAAHKHFLRLYSTA